jgi:hypothetical protein
MIQLDAVESFGNKALPEKVIEQVERALDELESEVEGRRRAKLATENKELKSRESVVIETEGAAGAAAFPVSENTYEEVAAIEP